MIFFRPAKTRSGCVRQVADLLGVSRFEAGRLRLKAAADGILDAAEEEVETAVEGRFRLN
jgi:hypothetical protein